VEQEFESIVNSIVNIKKKSIKGFGGLCTLQTSQLITSLVKLTDETGIQIDKTLMPISLKILRKVIEMENTNITTPAADWSTEEWIDFQDQIEEK
jgi:hypothetical protein